MYGVNVIAAAAVISLLCVVQGQYEGDTCIVRSTGGPGSCKILTACAAAIASIRKGIFPQTCGFKGSQPIVCCSNEDGNNPITPTPEVTTRSTTQPTTPPTRPTTPPTQPPTPPTNPTSPPNIGPRNPGEVSRAKCREYAKYIYKIERFPTLIPGATTSKIRECGYEAVKLIVGGTKAERLEFPHMALVGFQPDQQDIRWICGGSLISEQYVLTAGHCLRHRDHGVAKFVRMGMINMDDSTYRQQFDIVDTIKHPDYNPPLHYNDIGLLKLNKAPKLNPYVRPACIYGNYKVHYQRAIASGWGHIGYDEDQSKDLLKVVLEFFEYAACNANYTGLSRLPNGINDNTMVCAGSHEEFKDSCQGDSGGPLQVYHDKSQDKIDCMYDVVGIVSFGKACGLAKNLPGVYTRVSAYVKWIEDIVWPL